MYVYYFYLRYCASFTFLKQEVEFVIRFLHFPKEKRIFKTINLPLIIALAALIFVVLVSLYLFTFDLILSFFRLCLNTSVCALIVLNQII